MSHWKTTTTTSYLFLGINLFLIIILLIGDTRTYLTEPFEFIVLIKTFLRFFPFTIGYLIIGIILSWISNRGSIMGEACFQWSIAYAVLMFVSIPIVLFNLMCYGIFKAILISMMR